MNENITIVCEEYPDQEAALKRYNTATVRDLLTLKKRNVNVTVKHCDINPHIKQNCDATSRVITSQVIVWNTTLSESSRMDA